MTSLADHNRKQMELLFLLAASTKLNLSCDKCGCLLFNPKPDTVLATFPEQIHVACTECDFTGYAIA